MEQPAKDELQAEKSRADWPRHAARLSVISFFACATLSCVTNNLLFRNSQQPQVMLRMVVDSIAALVLLGGFICGIAGLIGGVRKKSADTIGIAIIGLVLQSGTVFVVLWGLWVLRSAK